MMKYSGYCFSVYNDEIPVDFFKVKSLIELLEGAEVIYNRTEDETHLHVIIKINNPYLGTYIRKCLTKLDKFAIIFNEYTQKNIDYLKKND